MTVTTRHRVGPLEVIRGLVQITPDLPVVLRNGPGFLLRRPSSRTSIGQVFADLAARQPERAFVKFEDQVLSYGQANAVINRYADVLLERKVGRGDVVGILGRNELETLLVTLATVKVGAVAGLLNYNQRGEMLAHSLGVLDARLLLVAPDCREVLDSAPGVVADDRVLGYAELRAQAEGKSEANPAITAELTGQDKAFYIFTSGTTGMPKASIMSHFRWLKSYSGLGALGVRLRPSDTMYLCLPLYHNNAVTVALGAVLAGGSSVAIGRKFSASGFWQDCRRYEATAFVYIGELCRYLLAQPPGPHDRDHQVRVIVGNGLRQDIWREFQERFAIPRIAEFYGASECNIAFINAFGINETAGTCPLPYRVVAYDPGTGHAQRDDRGRLAKVGIGEVGLLICKVTSRSPFDGYTDPEATERKLLRDGFRTGDVWFNTGDLVRNQGLNHVAFVDRLGDTFRWKGENVATTEVEAALARVPEIEDCAAYGVQVPGTDGRAGMAAIVLRPGAHLQPQETARRLAEVLPAYARPLFLREVSSLEQTSTFKSRKVALRDEGYRTDDRVWVLDGDEGYVDFYEEYLAEIAGARPAR